MGLPSYPSAHDGLLQMLVASAVLMVALLKNTARSLLSPAAAAASSSTGAGRDTPLIDQSEETDLMADKWRAVSLVRFRSLWTVSDTAIVGGRSSSGGTAVEQCCVCLSGFEEEEEVSELRCRHFFHKGCLQEWFNNLCSVRKLTCPLCRSLLYMP